MAAPFWTSDAAGLYVDGDLYPDNAHDTCWLAGRQLPGICTLTAPGIGFTIDKNKPNGGDATALILRGYNAADIDVEVLIWTPDQWAKFQEVLAAVYRPPTKASPIQKAPSGKNAAAVKAGRDYGQAVDGVKNAAGRAIGFFHPAVSSPSPFAIDSVVISTVSPPQKTGDPQARTIRIRCVQYVAADKVKNRTTRVKATGQAEAPTKAAIVQQPSPGAAEGGPK